jgi:hypothetical protein
MPSSPEHHPALSLGVGDPFGFGGNISAAKLALVHDLADPPRPNGADPVADGTLNVLELRVHGVGGSSPEQLLEQADYVQVGGDSLAQFVRRWGSRRRIVPWPLEGYWWGGLTSQPATRALWVLLTPLMFCNLAAWGAPAPPSGQPRQPWGLRLAGRCLAVVVRWAGYALTLMLTASVATASIDTFGWQCAVVRLPGGGACRPGWLGWVPAGAGPRMTLFALVPVAVLAVIGYACHQTLGSYERWRIRPVSGTAPKSRRGGGSASPLTTDGFWHGLRPVRRLQLLHLAGAAGLVSLYLAWVPASHPGWRTAAIVAAFVMIAAPTLLLASPQAGRPGDNPYEPADAPARAAGPSNAVTSFDKVAGAVLAVSIALLVALMLARLWWRPEDQLSSGFPGVMPGDAGIWEALSVAMLACVVAAFVLTGAAKAMIARTRAGADDARPFRPFAGGFLGAFTLGLACVTGGILAAGVNLALPRLLIGTAFSVGPGFTGQPSAAYPIEVAWPLFGFMATLLVMAAALVLVALCCALPFFWLRARAIRSKLGSYYTDADMPRSTPAQLQQVARQWALSRAADLLGLAVAVLSVAGVGGVIAFYVASPHPGDTQSFLITWVVRIGQWLVGLGAVSLYGYTVSAFSTPGKRKAIGVLWDVGTFWPRACQPFAPPCYMERSVPELVNRLNGLLLPSDAAEPTRPAALATEPTPATELARMLAARRAPEATEDELADWVGELVPRYDRILINGYSQGTAIAAAVIAQLPTAERISLVTVGSPLRRLFCRGFPAYFGRDYLLELRTALGGDAARWRNAVRKSDYIGDFVFDDPYDDTGPAGGKHGVVDQMVLDPPCLVADDGDDVTLPPIHCHSDFWPDPQVALMTKALIDSARSNISPGEEPTSQGEEPTEMPDEAAAEPTPRPLQHDGQVP